MTQTLLTYESGSFDPFLNLATEQHLLDTVEGGCCLLYLWQNQNTVVIGKNQNPWAECRASLLESEGGHLARRLSGGGAVFHDLGNLNFTFLVPTEDYDLGKQQRVLLEACQSFGIPAELSGRNDLTADGRKFSGNAFYHNGPRSYHHGTLLVNVDGEKLSRYLTPTRAKLEAKGVPSVRSRVVNLMELCPSLSIDGLKKALVEAFEKVYGLKSAPRILTEADTARIGSLREQYASRSRSISTRASSKMQRCTPTIWISPFRPPLKRRWSAAPSGRTPSRTPCRPSPTAGISSLYWNRRFSYVRF